MQKNNLGILTAIAFFLGGCNFASSRYEYNVDCKNLDVYEFKLKTSSIKYKITGYLEEDAEVYVQSYDEGKPQGWSSVYLKKGIVSHADSFETYASKGRLIYIPKGNTNRYYFRKKDKLVVQIQTAYD